MNMIQEHRQELQRLAELSADDIGDNENSVKYNFIIPFLESFGYNKKLDFEHSAQGNRIDILIDKVSHHNILIEAKSYGKNLDAYIPQLKRYCDEKRPVLAIITNGDEIRFYSPFCRKPDFAETLIYSVTRHHLSDDATIEKIEKVFGKQFLEDDSIIEHIEEREKEIKSIKKEIQSLDLDFQEKITGLDVLINSLEEQNKSLQSQIDSKKTEVADLRREKDRKIEELKKKHLVHLSQTMQETPTALIEPSTTGPKKPLGGKGYKQFNDYLIPVIRLIKSGVKHTDAFRQIAKKLIVANSTVSAECTRSLNISTEEFIELVKSNRIKSFLKDRFPDKASLIDQEL
ncbi:MAG: hypothetical protein MUO27_09065 [Sedimentisphaerales bacterium]|nr:hypothetical protein [Sedimentisphaerales bacterium]